MNSKVSFIASTTVHNSLAVCTFSYYNFHNPRSTEPGFLVKEHTMKKTIIVIAAIIIPLISFIAYKRHTQSNQNYDFTICIVQTASHPALDAARQGFISELTKKLGERVQFIEQNAQGSIDTLQAIAQRMHSKPSITAFYAIATPALQALASVEHTRPIVFAAVSNPDALHLPDMHHIAGVTDMISVDKQIDLMLTLMPALRTVALIYNTGEVNSVHMAQQMEQTLASRGINALTVSIQNETDIPAAVASACQKADALLAPSDNSIASAINSITAVTRTYKKPLFVSDSLLVSQGALAAYGVDYYKCGEQAGAMLYEIVAAHKSPQDFGSMPSHDQGATINATRAAELGIIIPESLNNDTTRIVS